MVIEIGDIFYLDACKQYFHIFQQIGKYAYFLLRRIYPDSVVAVVTYLGGQIERNAQANYF
jgi:hypothetical protein